MHESIWDEDCKNSQTVLQSGEDCKNSQTVLQSGEDCKNSQTVLQSGEDCKKIGMSMERSKAGMEINEVPTAYHNLIKIQ